MSSWFARFVCLLFLPLLVGCEGREPDVASHPSAEVEASDPAAPASIVPGPAADVGPTDADVAEPINFTVSEDWPQWRGPDRDGRSREKGLLQRWPEKGPALRWTARELGAGYSSPSVRDGRVYLAGETDGKVEAICLDHASGKEWWRTPFAPAYENAWGGGPRGAPTLDGDRLYVLAPTGELACLSIEDGKKIWSKNLVADFRGGIPHWGYSESPLVDGDRVVVTPGGAQCIVALNKATGEKVLASSGLSDGAHYASIVIAEVGKRRLYVTMTAMGLVGVDAESGEFQFRYEKTGNGTAVIPTPVVVKNFIYSTSGYGTGCGLVKLTPAGDKINATEVYFNKFMKNQHGGVLFLAGHIYGFSDQVGWLCQNFKTGAVVWRSERSLGKGAICYADGRLYCYGEDDGACVLADASPKAWQEFGRFIIPEKTKLERGSGKIWTHPVVAEGTLILRDQDLLFCFDVTKK